MHQPILIGLVWAVAASGVFAPAAPANLDRPTFLAECRRSCIAKGGTTDTCELSCRCVADAIDRSGDAGKLDKERDAEIKRMVDACIGR